MRWQWKQFNRVLCLWLDTELGSLFPTLLWLSTWLYVMLMSEGSSGLCNVKISKKNNFTVSNLMVCMSSMTFSFSPVMAPLSYFILDCVMELGGVCLSFLHCLQFSFCQPSCVTQMRKLHDFVQKEPSQTERAARLVNWDRGRKRRRQGGGMIRSGLSLAMWIEKRINERKLEKRQENKVGRKRNGNERNGKG